MCMDKQELHLRWALEERAMSDGRRGIRRKMETKRRRNGVRAAVWMGAAACLIAAVGLWMLEKPADNGAIPDPTVKLTLADGTTIDAAKAAAGSVENGGWKVELNDDGELQYEQVQPEAPAAKNVVTVSPGAQIVLKLDDGTRVVVNSNSRLEFTTPLAQGGARALKLDGEAWFEVAHDAATPFRVQSGGFALQVYGTEFNMNTRGGQSVEVVLVAGSVGFTGRADAVEQRLSPSQRAVVDRATGAARIEAVDTYPFTAWKDGEIVCVNEPLGSVMERLAEWYGLEVEFADETVRQMRFDISVPKYPRVSSLFYYLEKITDLHFELDGKKVLIH